MIQTVNLSKEAKFGLVGLLVALLISLFTFFVVRNYAEKSDAKHKAEMQLMNVQLQKRADLAQFQAEEIQKQNELNYQLSERLEEKFNTQTILLQNI